LQMRTQKLLDFLEKSGPNLYALLTRLTLRQDVAEDLMQELFIKLSTSRAFDRAENPFAYAYKAAANLAFDWRQKRRRQHISLIDVREPASNANSPLSKLAQKEQLQQVLDAIGQLTELLRQAFVMRHIQQNSYQEIAQMLGRDQHHVRVLCSRAMTQLRSLLESNEPQSSRKEVSSG
jgi:RNA polymerase sigma-70 factor (ECF subfamily)